MLLDIINHIAHFASVKVIVLILLAEKENWEQKEGVYFWREILVSKKVSDSWVFPQLKNACVKDGFSIPPRVKTLLVKNYFDRIVSLPETLKYLSVEFSIHSKIYSVLPEGLERLTVLENTFQPFEIREGIKTLQIFSTNSLEYVPKSVTTLILGYVIHDLSIPNTVKKLSLSFFGKILPNLTIPTSVKTLRLCNYHRINRGFIPDTVEKLTLSAGKESFVFVPKGVAELTIRNFPDAILYRNYEFEDPGNIKRLKIDKNAPKSFIARFVGLKRITYLLSSTKY